MLPSVAGPALQYNSTLSHKTHDFLKHVTEHKMCVLIVCTTWSETFLIPERIQPDIICVQRSSRTVWSALSEFYVKHEFPRQIIEKTAKYKISAKLPPVGVELLDAGRQADRRTADMNELIVAILSLTKAPKTQEKAANSRD
jgi:hypothetical protein